MSSESAKTFGFMMRPAVFRVFEQLADIGAGRLLLHQLQHGGRQFFRQVIDDCRHVVGGSSWVSLTISSAERPERRRSRFRPELRSTPPSRAGCCARRGARRPRPDPCREARRRAEQVGGILLLEQVDEVRRRPHALKALDEVEHDVELALQHRNCPM